MIPLAQVAESGQAPTLMQYEGIVQNDAAQWDFLPLNHSGFRMNQEWEKLKSPGHLLIQIQ